MLQLSSKLSKLKLDAVYTSPLERTRETATSLATPHQLQPLDDDALREMNFGSWEGKSFTELEPQAGWRLFNQSRSELKPPGGESMAEVQRRIVKFVESLCGRHKDATLALVSHAEPLRLLIGHWLKIPLDCVSRLSLDPASVSLARVQPDWIEVKCVNVKGELIL